MFVAQGRAVFFAAYRASELGHTKTLDAGYALLSLDFHAVSFRCAALREQLLRFWPPSWFNNLQCLKPALKKSNFCFLMWMECSPMAPSGCFPRPLVSSP